MLLTSSNMTDVINTECQQHRKSVSKIDKQTLPTTTQAS